MRRDVARCASHGGWSGSVRQCASRVAVLALAVSVSVAGSAGCRSAEPVEAERSGVVAEAVLADGASADGEGGRTSVPSPLAGQEEDAGAMRKTTPLVQPPGATAHLDDERNTIEVFDAVAPAAVFIAQKRKVRRRGRAVSEVTSGTGTGFIWDDAGHVVTNYHVVDGADTLEVTLFNQKTYEARLVGGEPRKDIAVLKIDAPASELSPVRLPKDGYRIAVGQKALAIGNPFGLDHTLTTGVVSALGREILGYGGVTIRDMVQTDASINPGNSGGPLLNSSGELIGMNTMIFSQSGSSAGIGFAVPVTVIRRMVPQIIATGRAVQVGLGVSLLSDDAARRAGLRGVVVTDVASGSPAEAAGIRGIQRSARQVVLGDIIVALDGKAVSSYDDLYNALDMRDPGEKVRVTLVRDGREVDVEVELYELP